MTAQAAGALDWGPMLGQPVHFTADCEGGPITCFGVIELVVIGDNDGQVVVYFRGAPAGSPAPVLRIPLGGVVRIHGPRVAPTVPPYIGSGDG